MIIHTCFPQKEPVVDDVESGRDESKEPPEQSGISDRMKNILLIAYFIVMLLLTGAVLVLAARIRGHFHSFGPIWRPCPRGYTHFSPTGHCYRAFIEELTFEESLDACVGDDAQLVTISSSITLVYDLSQFLTTLLSTANPMTRSSWIRHYRVTGDLLGVKVKERMVLTRISEAGDSFSLSKSRDEAGRETDEKHAFICERPRIETSIWRRTANQ